GDGELFGGGGGSGGRIAVYGRSNYFFGAATADGGVGVITGGEGTLTLSDSPPLLLGFSNWPHGLRTNGVSSATVYFSGAPNPSAVNNLNVSLQTPYGQVYFGDIGVARLSSGSYQINFPLQTTPGDYALTVSNGVTDLYGRSLSQVYTG